MTKQLGFRKPDSQFGQDWAVWYGRGGAQGDCATECEKVYAGYHVKEFLDIRGYFDTGTYDATTPYLVTSTFVSAKEIEDAAQEFDSISTSIEIAARLGVDKIAEQGGTEEFAEQLPQ